MERQVYRGEIYYARLYETVGSEQAGVRPVVIVQNNIGNRYAKTVIIVPLTSKIETNEIQPTHVVIKAFGNIKYDSTILTEQVRTIDKTRLGERIGTLPYKYIKKVDKALAIAQGIEKIHT